MHQSALLALVNLSFLIVVFLSVTSTLNGSARRTVFMPRYCSAQPSLAALEVFLGPGEKVRVNGSEADLDGLSLLLRHCASVFGSVRVTLLKSAALDALLQVLELARSSGIADLTIFAVQ